jgi:hypothetical protein
MNFLLQEEVKKERGHIKEMKVGHNLLPLFILIPSNTSHQTNVTQLDE